MTRPTLSAAVITLNEQHNLPGLLASLLWADEILVVDGGSTDATLDIAREAGCRVISRRFDNFAQQRNHAIEMARGEWILSIDADERPTVKLVSEIGRRIAAGRHDAFHVPIRSRIFRHQVRRSGTQDDRPVRLFRRHAARWVGDVHERLAVVGRIGRLQHWLEHDTLPDVDAFYRKMHRYTTLEAEARVRTGRRPQWRDTWLAPAREVFRRLIWKQGALDGPAGWQFCLLSGWSEWVLAEKHRRLWRQNVCPSGAP